MTLKNIFILKSLRDAMKSGKFHSQPLKAYIVPHGDAHQSEYVCPSNERLHYISGFSGSSGMAVITDAAAALWTDGRYYLQADRELEDHWDLMKQGLPTTVTPMKWLKQKLRHGERAHVGVDPFLIDYKKWRDLSDELEEGGHSLVPVDVNLIDHIWKDRPALDSRIVVPLEENFTGASLSAKVMTLREKLQEDDCTAIILTALDEIAYLFNLRGSDITYNPVFFSYSVVTCDEAVLFIDEAKLHPSAKHYLTSGSVKVQIYPYNALADYVTELLRSTTGCILVSPSSSYGVNLMVPKDRKVSKPSPVAVMKAIKNPTEIQGFVNCHVRDGVALCRYFAWLEGEARKGTQDEISAAEKLLSLREDLELFMGLSFETISSSGPNAAIVHYRPSAETARKITTEEIYLCDSGGQYKDGTTDVTRTIHFGTPTRFECESFTRVLKGVIALASSVFPSKIKGSCLDTLARKSLWDVGLDYGHGTGHGVGMYLCVHEGPMGISYRQIPDDPGLQEGMFLSDEPGYYEDGKFGIRLENIVQVVKADTPYNHQQRGFLTFRTVTMVPIQRKLILPEMLTQEEVSWLNNYHTEVRESIGPLLREGGYKEAYEWLFRETEPIG